MNTFDKVIFVCNGNTCRSPMAATVMANLKQDIISESRGMVVLFQSHIIRRLLRLQQSII